MRASIVVGLSRVSICDIRSRKHPYGTLWIHPGNHSQSCAFLFLVSHVYVVVQSYPLVKLYSLLFWGMVMYDNEFKTKEIKFKSKTTY